MIKKKYLEKLYIKKKNSVAEISKILNCSQNKVNYWINKHEIKKRTISDAVYIKNNPNGDPFTLKKLTTKNDHYLFGLGIGLYWGEGTKSNKHSVRLGNTDPYMILKFIEFLDIIYGINKNKLKYGLQVFNDMSEKDAVKFWMKHLKAKKDQFQKVVVTPSRGVGTYRQKTKYGVLTVHFNNKKLRDIICNTIDNLKKV